MNKYIKFLIKQNETATCNVAAIEETLKDYPVTDEKTKANFGNLCVALRGYRMVVDATEAMLINENVLKSEEGDFYEKVNTDGSDNDIEHTNANDDQKPNE